LQEGQKVRLVRTDADFGFWPLVGWVRAVDRSTSAPQYMIFSSGRTEWVSADEVEILDGNPHPGREHHASFCPNCGY
jgi:hypothetical protein